ncbi:immunity 53 family protein [Clostridium aciditolerans]|uniref:Immunity 53 family protein n=1 Tax=Clostridium aciditolerans TaxID=339861 RepID=A0A934HYD7_9CLOT|nr:immunity 53 family protein [Clostridium aciditolerans]MBI6871796.1 immunity 53 family protein [Clostridium aciditolerans]
MNIIKWIQDWYIENCDEDWEHCYGVTISTLDNPGWLVDIDLVDTDLEFKKFDELNIYINESNWIQCVVDNGVFKGRGDARKLEEILTVFKQWVLFRKPEDKMGK